MVSADIFVCCLSEVYRPIRDFFTHMETSPLPVKGCKFWPIVLYKNVDISYPIFVIHKFWIRNIRLWWSSPGTRAFKTLENLLSVIDLLFSFFRASVRGGCKNFIRLSISVCPVDKIEKGIDILSGILRSYGSEWTWKENTFMKKNKYLAFIKKDVVCVFVFKTAGLSRSAIRHLIYKVNCINFSSK